MAKKSKPRYGDYCEEIDGVLYASITIPGSGGKKRRKKVLNRADARIWALAELDRLKYGSLDEKTFDTFNALAEWYKTHYLRAPVYENGLKVDGVKDWKKSQAKLDRMTLFFGPKRLRFFNETDLRAYANERRSRDKVSTATLNRDFALMRAMFKKGKDANTDLVIPKFPINTAAEVERDRVMSFEEEAAILAVCDDVEELEYERKGKTVKAAHKTNRAHLRAIVIIAVDTAMRSGEIFSLTWDDVNLETGIITIRRENNKIGKGRKIGITPRVKVELTALAKSKGKVFSITSARKAFATACRRAKITDLHFHDLRHTATTRMIRAGIPHAEVMKITGHTQMRTFMRYLNLVDTTMQNTAALLANYVENNNS